MELVKLTTPRGQQYNNQTPNFAQEQSPIKKQNQQISHSKSKSTLITTIKQRNNPTDTLSLLKETVRNQIKQAEKQISTIKDNQEQTAAVVDTTLGQIAHHIRDIIGFEKYTQIFSNLNNLSGNNEQSKQKTNNRYLQLQDEGAAFITKQRDFSHNNSSTQADSTDLKAIRNKHNHMQTVIETVGRMKMDIMVKQEELRNLLQGQTNVQALIYQLEYSVSSAFDMFLNLSQNLEIKEPILQPKNMANAKTQTPSDGHYFKPEQKKTIKKEDPTQQPKAISAFPVIKLRVKHPSPDFPDQINLIEGHYQGPASFHSQPNGHGKFIYLHAKDDTHLYSFVYVGHFLNGVFHGTGKKMDGQGYKIECEFVNGRAQGFGRQYYPGGNLMYEGQFLNGGKNGFGKKFYPSGKIMFEGFLKDSKWTGFGRKYFEHNPNGTATPQIWYEGECLDNVPHGFGKYYHAKNAALWYEGHFQFGKFDGFGKQTDASEGLGLLLLYEGSWRDGLKHGIGAYHYDKDYIFEGRWHMDLKVEGIVTYLNCKLKQVFFTAEDFERGKVDQDIEHQRQTVQSVTMISRTPTLL